MEEFLKEPGRKAVYFQAERLLSDAHKSRTAIKFVSNANEWEDQTCYLYRGNVYENVIGCIRRLTENNPNKTKYFFVVDSTNALVPEGDLDKSFQEANKVAGGALLASDFLRRLTLRFCVEGHFCFLIGQVRSTIKINQYEKVAPKLSNNTGSYAVDHYSDNIFEFQKAYGKDYIYKNASEKKDKLGKYAKVILRKTNFENENVEVDYPLKFGKTGQGSIWKEKEVIDMLISWCKLQKNAAWITPSEDVIGYVKEVGLEFPEKGLEKDYLSWLEEPENKPALDILFHQCKNLALFGTFK